MVSAFLNPKRFRSFWKKHWLRAGYAALVCLAAADTSHAQAIYGTVKTTAGVPIPDVNLSATRNSPFQRVTTTTDFSGGYVLGSGLSGTYNVVPTEPTYTFTPSSTNVTVSGSSVMVNFTTPSTVPSAVTSTATNVAATTAILRGSVNPNGGATTAFFEYGLTASYGNTSTSVSVGSGTAVVQVSIAVTNLVPGTNYHFRMAANNSHGTRAGSDATFNTHSGVPAVTTLGPTDPAPGSRKLNGSITPSEVNTSGWFEWGSTTNYGNATTPQALGSGTTATNFSQTVTGLIAGVTYHHRAVAATSFTTNYGSDKTFTSLLPGDVQPLVLRNMVTNLGVSWFGAPIIYDLDGDGRKELIGTFASINVWDADMNLLHKTNGNGSRIYSPAVVADLDRDGVTEIVVGQSSMITAYEWKNGKLSRKVGWPYTTFGSSGVEVRSLAAADLDNNGTLEIIASTTSPDIQVFVLSPNGTLYQPPGLTWNAWPRYNTATGTGNDGDSNGQGNHGYGCYGLNVGVGNLDDNPQLEIVVTYDNHLVNVFNHDGVSTLASDYYTKPNSPYFGYRLNWGQMIRWFDPTVESQHYHDHTGTYPNPDITPWCQWTASPCSIADLNGDGRNEVIGVPNVEFHIPYETIHYSVMVLEGNYGDGSRSARRLAGWENLPSGGAPLPRSSDYPPTGIPAPTTVDIIGDGHPEVVASMNDGYLYAFANDGTQLWRTDVRHGRQLMYTSEILVSDLNRDGTNELILTTYGNPDNFAPGQPHGYLMILNNRGDIIYDIELPTQGTNGNGKGAPAAPTLGDLDGDGTLEIVAQTFDGSCFVYNVPGSTTRLMPWPTARGSYLRQGRSFRTGPPTPPLILNVGVTGNGATIDWTADPYTYQTLEICTNLAGPVPSWSVLKAYSPPSNPTNHFIDLASRNAAYYRVRAE